jgi:aryl-phospho-beta-D-glucosidase BglC (GH1 family)
MNTKLFKHRHCEERSDKATFGKLGMTVALALLLFAAGCSDDNNNPNNTGGDTPEKFTTRYRGINFYTDENDEISKEQEAQDIDRLNEWGVNLVRWWFSDWNLTENDNNPTPTTEEFRAFIAEQIDRFDDALPTLKEHGIKVCLTLGSTPGGRAKDASGTHKMFQDVAYQEEFVRIWEEIATRYKDEEAIVMYDLMNEPAEGSVPDIKGLLNLNDLFVKTAQAIRALGDNTEIVYEPSAHIDGYVTYRWFQPFDVPGIVYSLHVYGPFELTHQGMSSSVPVNVTYPGEILNHYWDAAKLRDAYRHFKRFIDDHHVRAFIGEFGCVRWAPNNSAYPYLKDCLEFFEEEGWDYTYFGYHPMCSYNHGANAWSAQHDTEYWAHPCPAEQEPDRLTLFKSYWARND